jgi:chromosomal replication initiation ATPase DnaA
MQNTNLALALDTQADEAAREELRDELAQFISEELIVNAAQARRALKVVKRRSSLASRAIQIDNGMFTPFRVR